MMSGKRVGNSDVGNTVSGNPTGGAGCASYSQIERYGAAVQPAKGGQRPQRLPAISLSGHGFAGRWLDRKPIQQGLGLFKQGPEALPLQLDLGP
jgi:hypothetical protein